MNPYILECVNNFNFVFLCLIPIIFSLGVIAGAWIAVALNRKWAKEDKKR
jgi:hypothetical protein